MFAPTTPGGRWWSGFSSCWVHWASSRLFSAARSPPPRRSPACPSRGGRSYCSQEKLTGPQKAQEIVILRNPALPTDDPAFQQAANDLYKRVLDLGPGIVESGLTYVTTPLPALVSADRHSGLLVFTLAGSLDDAGSNVPRVLKVINEANGQGGYEVVTTGLASIGHDFQTTAEQDLRTGEMIGVGVALIILLLVFGTVVAALIPVGLAVASITVAIGLAAVTGQFFQLSYFVTNMITMMGLAVGIDYSLFVVSRYREERRAGREKIDAVARTGATAGRSVLFSGMTVILALAGMLIVPTSIFRSLAIGAILVVAVAVLAALTLLPAVLGLVGDRVNSLRVPFLRRDALRVWGRPRGRVLGSCDPRGHAPPRRERGRVDAAASGVRRPGSEPPDRVGRRDQSARGV